MRSQQPRAPESSPPSSAPTQDLSPELPAHPPRYQQAWRYKCCFPSNRPDIQRLFSSVLLLPIPKLLAPSSSCGGDRTGTREGPLEVRASISTSRWPCFPAELPQRSRFHPGTAGVLESGFSLSSALSSCSSHPTESFIRAFKAKPALIDPGLVLGSGDKTEAAVVSWSSRVRERTEPGWCGSVGWAPPVHGKAACFIQVRAHIRVAGSIPR